MAVTIKPLDDRILVKQSEAEETTAGGIVLPDTAKEKPQEGKVISVGTGQRLKSGKIVSPSVKKGDIILFSKYSGNEVKIDDEEYLIISEKDILAIIK